jgi:hypothetical protein
LWVRRPFSKVWFSIDSENFVEEDFPARALEATLFFSNCLGAVKLRKTFKI